MTKKLLLLAFILLLNNSVFSYEVPKNEEYYKAQIQNQRFLYNTSGLFNAIQSNRNDLVELYMKAGFDPNSTFVGSNALTFALYKNNLEAFDILLQYGANPETKNLLYFSILRKSSSAVKSLIKYNVDVNAITYDISPLNQAIKTKQPVIVEMLLKAGAKPNDKTMKLIDKSKDEYIKNLLSEYNETNEK